MSSRFRPGQRAIVPNYLNPEIAGRGIFTQ